MSTKAHPLWHRFGMRALAVLAPIGCVLVFLLGAAYSATPEWRWFWIARLPLPAEAMDVHIQYPSNDVTRELTFVSAQSAAEIREFYRTELPARGWRYHCTFPDAPPCGEVIGDVFPYLVEIYTWVGAPEGEGPQLTVIIEQPGADPTMRRVSLHECCIYSQR